MQTSNPCLLDLESSRVSLNTSVLRKKKGSTGLRTLPKGLNKDIA